MPFNFGHCPACGGSNIKEVESSETISMRVYWVPISPERRPQRFRGIDVPITVPEGSAMTIGHAKDLPKIRRANEVILIDDKSAYIEYRCTMVDEPRLHGLGKKDYFIAFWKRS